MSRFVLVSGVAVVGAEFAAGFDPGLTKRLAATAFPNLPNFFEDCPDAPGGHCNGTLAPGSGFYTIGDDGQKCMINAGADSRWTPNDHNPDVPCPFKFSWQSDEDEAVARLEVDSRDFVSGMTPNLYVGLQENLPTSHVYGGIDSHNRTMCPMIRDVTNITFEIRAKRCYGAALSPGDGFGRVAAYFGIWNTKANQGTSVSVDIFTFVDGESKNASSLPLRRPEPFKDDGNAWHIDGAIWGLMPRAEPVLDTSADCSMDMREVPWMKVVLPVPDILERLEAKGILDASIVDGSFYDGSQVVGPETWGRHWTVAEIKRRFLMVSDEPPVSLQV